MPEPMVELVQQDVQVYSAPDDFFASIDDDSRARVREWSGLPRRRHGSREI